MIKAVLEQAVKSIEAEKAQQLANAKERVTREKIVPFNTEIDSARAKALAEVDTELTQKVSALRSEYEEKKKELIRLGEEKKKQNADAVLANELSVISIDYDDAIAKLNDQISKIDK